MKQSELKKLIKETISEELNEIRTGLALLIELQNKEMKSMISQPKPQKQVSNKYSVIEEVEEKAPNKPVTAFDMLQEVARDMKDEDYKNIMNATSDQAMSFGMNHPTNMPVANQGGVAKDINGDMKQVPDYLSKALNRDYSHLV